MDNRVPQKEENLIAVQLNATRFRHVKNDDPSPNA